MSAKKRVCIVGSGNWGSAIAKIIGSNVPRFESFENEVRMYVYEEYIDGRKLSEIINTEHVNVRYLPDHKLPENVVAVPDLLQAAEGADILVFVLPHQFVRNTCNTLKGKIKPGAIGISLIKGFDQVEGGGIVLISHVISEILSIPVSVLMGANLAQEVADEKFCETTIGCRDPQSGRLLRDLIQTNYFRVVVVDDVEAVEVCGALKNIVACGAGFVDGLGYGDNTKAAVIRLGLMEMIKFCEVFYPGSKLGTFFESCGVADLITTCYGGRNRRVSEAFVRTGKSIEELEKEMLKGQHLQGPMTAVEVNYMLKSKDMESRFPLFTAIDNICKGLIPPSDLIECIRNHPEHMALLGNVNYFGGSSTVCSKYNHKLQIAEKENVNAMFVVISDIWLDKLKVMEKLKALFQGYSTFCPMAFILCGNFSSGCNFDSQISEMQSGMSALGDIIAAYPELVQKSRFVFVPGPNDPGPRHIYPRPPLPTYVTQDLAKKVPSAEFVSSPCRIQYCSQEIVIFREDVFTKMCRNCLYYPAEDENIATFFARTIICEAHLSPLPPVVLPTYWGMDHCLSLHPTPDVVIMADKGEAFHVRYNGCSVINPGSFVRTDFQFKVYHPSERLVEDSQIPD